jgi:hypothetical protein
MNERQKAALDAAKRELQSMLSLIQEAKAAALTSAALTSAAAAATDSAATSAEPLPVAPAPRFLKRLDPADASPYPLYITASYPVPYTAYLQAEAQSAADAPASKTHRPTYPLPPSP